MSIFIIYGRDNYNEPPTVLGCYNKKKEAKKNMKKLISMENCYFEEWAYTIVEIPFGNYLSWEEGPLELK